ncbi:hypothetical protein FEM03_04740 [Phragmitibacter flavus]|uniref:DUF1444 family protein n=1 Tax=Phragmitibacter flavus TaxID=2576071 RepID=A0A5R8KJC5_9BACT|nr:hypothetical protein [Phragmitibacter flavus]TLD72035.1 hypothetical protein FEM03_04740 [Phragmitibacter flavus]
MNEASARFPLVTGRFRLQAWRVRSILLFPLWLGLSLVTSADAQSPSPTVARALKPETYLLQIEPKAMRTANSRPYGSAQKTVFTPAKEVGGDDWLDPYNKEDFEKLGISWESFVERARKAADRRLASLKPELVKDREGRVLYAVYRGAEPVYSSLLVAPSLAKVFEKIFGGEVWLATPDRNSLYVFPANAEVVNDFAGDLEERFQTNAFAASEEIFSLNTAGELRAVAVFTER